MLSFHDIPGSHNFVVFCPAHAAADATADKLVWVAPYKLRLTAFRYVVATAVSGANTHSRNLNVKKIVPGGATTEVAHTDLVLNTNLAVGRNTVALNSGTYVDVNAGDLIVLESEKVGANGLAVVLGALEIVGQGN